MSGASALWGDPIEERIARLNVASQDDAREIKNSLLASCSVKT